MIHRCRLGTGVKKVILFSWLEGAEVRYKSLTRGQEEGNKELLVTEGDTSSYFDHQTNFNIGNGHKRRM